jgi:transcriptional regulator with XRE-family HTH domain
MISKIERGESSPTAAILGRLSGALGLTMSQLLARADAARGQLSAAAAQPVWEDRRTGLRRRNLSPETGNPTPLELVWAELPSGKRIHYPAAAFAFIDDQQIIVVEGRLRVRLRGTDYVVEPGDCLRLGSPADCDFENLGASPCQYIVAVLRAK